MTDPSAASASTDLLTESRAFPPGPAFGEQANAGRARETEADQDVEALRAARAAELRWERTWHQVLQPGEAGTASWFVDGRVNVAVNCVDRHVESGHGDQVALQLDGRARRHQGYHLHGPARPGVSGGGRG